MKRFAMVVLALVLGALAVRAQEEPRGVAAIGRYQHTPGGVLDTWSGASYFVDPEDPARCVSLDLPRGRAFIRDVGKDVSGFGTVDLPKLDPSIIPAAKERHFVATGVPHEVLDTKTGALYTLESPPRSKVSDWKGVKVVRTDPVLSVRSTRELQVSRRGG